MSKEILGTGGQSILSWPVWEISKWRLWNETEYSLGSFPTPGFIIIFSLIQFAMD